MSYVLLVEVYKVIKGPVKDENITKEVVTNGI